MIVSSYQSNGEDRSGRWTLQQNGVVAGSSASALFCLSLVLGEKLRPYLKYFQPATQKICACTLTCLCETACPVEDERGGKVRGREWVGGRRLKRVEGRTWQKHYNEEVGKKDGLERGEKCQRRKKWKEKMRWDKENWVLMEIAGGVTVLSILAHRSSHYSFTPWLCPALWSSPTASPGAGIHPAQPSCQHKRSSGPGICQPTQSTFSHSLLASPYWHSTAQQGRKGM